MIRARHIGLIVLLILAGALLPAKAANAPITTELCTSEAHSTTHSEHCFTLSEMPIFSLSPSTVTPPSITPVVRTLSRTSPSVERLSQYSKAVRAIDSTMTASRYGLYNHKILFYPHARMYYLNRLVRLII